ncbi:DEAD/DEAH box helicase [Chitinophaga nivalis]|uniref:DEAD/DEAH box helicase n=1 Tax=Chitinophaga nivalis TaxID=2991709 RepID=A0ABT3IPL0_9BACT|nr:DEAD/DEAH box helicase [Chitinophaga nivalis]MCW3464400.1 DEAD/DEAH box helicase [Chitinophaga nivalis]MCW3485909.1 DEAD/DEAH box helicase [Chitinophaga nivalis]
MVNATPLLEQYAAKEPEVRRVVDVLTIYLYPLEHHTLTDALRRLTDITTARVTVILQELMTDKLVVKNVAGSYGLSPVLGLALFPEVIKNPHYTTILEGARRPAYAFYSINARLQELQQLLVAYFTGDRSLLGLPIRKIGLEVDEYQPVLSYLLYFPVYHALLQLFSEESMQRILAYAGKYHLLQLPPVAALLDFQRQQQFVIPELALLQGDFAPPPADDSAAMHFIHGIRLLYSREQDKAYTAFQQGLKRQRVYDKKSKLPQSPFFAFYYAFSLAVLPAEKGNPLITGIMSAHERKLLPEITPAIALLYLHAGKKEKAEQVLQLLLERQESHLLSFLAILCLQLLHPKSKLLRTFHGEAGRLLSLTLRHHYRLLAYEYLYLFRDEHYLGYKEEMEQIRKITGYDPAFALLELVPDWERLLNTLLTTHQPAKGKEKEQPVYRLIYLIDFDHYTILPVQQTAQGNSWSTGRNVALKKLKEGKVEGMTTQDSRIAATIQKNHYFNHDGESFSFDSTVWETIAGHPLLFAADAPGISVEIVKDRPELQVQQTDRGYVFSSNIADFISETVFIRESPVRMKVIPLTAPQRKVLQTLEQVSFVPPGGKEKLLQVLQSVGAHLTIHSDVGSSQTAIPKRAGDARIVVQLLPLGEGLKATFFVKPFTADPPYCQPGTGAKNVYGISNGERCQAVRDLAKEAANLTEIWNLVQAVVPQELAGNTLVFEDPLDCLQLLEIILENASLIRAEWPEGERYKVSRQAGFPELHVTLREKDHWFTCEGTLQADEATVLSLKELLDTTRTVKQRFVALHNGEFVALTADLRKRLNELSAFATIDRDDIRVHPLAGPALEDLLQHAGSSRTDAAWQAFEAVRKEAMRISPQVPVTLQTTLRPYQEEGFRWMAYLAAWGAGACLADDMGLGKTIQAIALLLYRAEQGAALVICPASVMPNWTNELARFAPSLRVVYLHNGKRKAVIDAAGPFDIVITTYGLLQSEERLLAGVKWTTVVLDEAHTIKNFQTKTSKAAMSLQAGFKLMLTGTPIQNHMSEIWNLFNFLNPGLLGSLDHFNKQFVFPSTRNPESSVKQHLKKLLAPFLLRRTKTAVLDELPPKTEIIKLVDLSGEEAAFYEALRRKAIENIQSYDKNMAQQHIRALAEISKLRMAACHPQLIDPEITIPAAKMQVFATIVQELVENNHRALVFSQFVRHLDLVRETLDELGITYLYLDGSTPLGQREKLVKDFQGGKGQLFLISLKAGGLGLNLTAADYVIHMDPWWNPAIEEQASDRAYRIGQTRPVTIYRLVARHTIEEKILQLHNNKRDLADQLLEGADQSARLNAAQLLELMAEG